MDQIKLLRVSSQNQPQLQKSYEFEEVVTTQIKKNKLSLEELEPWNQDSDKNPFISIKSQRIKKQPSLRIKKQGSISVSKSKICKPAQKVTVQRLSKILPVMDVGGLNKIRRSLYPGKTISKLDLNSPAVALAKIRSRKEITLPSVTRQLSIQRKIFLMKGANAQQNQVSPPKSSSIRSILQDLKK